MAAKLREAGTTAICLHDLTGGYPGGWNDTDVDDGGGGRLFLAVLELASPNDEVTASTIRAVVAASGGAIAAYRTDERYVMVENCRPTPLGFRGLDAVHTIEEAGASNQLGPMVERAIFG